MARQTPDRQLNRLLSRLEPPVRRAFLQAIKDTRRSVNIAELVEALERNDIERAIDMLRIRDQVLFPLSESIRSAYIAGGLLAGEKLPVTVRATFGFGSNPRAEAAAQAITGQLIDGIQSDNVETMRNVIAAGVGEGIPVRKLAQQITGKGRSRSGGFLGLSSTLADSVIRGRSDLLSGDPARMRRYLTLELRNKRKDGQIRRAITEGRRLTTAEVDEIIEAHRAKALGYRGRLIARDQTLKAARKGQHAGFQQLAETIGADRIVKTWKVRRDGRERESHALLGGTEVRFDQNFISPATGAPMAYPGDETQGALGEDVIQCRCAVTYRIKR